MRFTWRDKVRYRGAIPTRLPLGLGLLLAKTAPMLGSLNRGQSGQQMDHLPQVLDPVRSPVDVPFVCAGFSLDLNPSTFQVFESIPYKYGYNADSVQRVSGQQALNQDLPFLQSWLFFRLLVQILGHIGVTLSHSDFVRRQDDGKLVITTEALPKYLWFWFAIRRHQARQETEDHAKLADS